MDEPTEDPNKTDASPTHTAAASIADSPKMPASKIGDAKCVDSSDSALTLESSHKTSESTSGDGAVSGSLQRSSTKDTPKPSSSAVTCSSTSLYSTHLKASKVGKPKNKMIKPAVSHQGQQQTSVSFSPFNPLRKTSNTSSPNTATPKLHPQPNYYGPRHASYGSSAYGVAEQHCNDLHSGSTIHPNPTAYMRGGQSGAIKGSMKSSTSPLRNNSRPHPFSPSSEGLHMLQSTWCLWILVDRQSSEVQWKDKMKETHDFFTVEGFWSMHNHMHTPSSFGLGDYYLFRKGITPDWNDRVFHNGGGRFVIQLPSKNPLLDAVWLMAILLLIGECYDYSDNSTSVCGAVASYRAKSTKIALWVASSDPHKIVEIGSEFFGAISKEFATNLTESKIDLKPEFETFGRGTPLDSLFPPQTDKLLVNLADLQKNYASNCGSKPL